MEKETESELSLKEREGDKRETEAGLETPKGRDLGLKEERARDEAEAAMGRRRDKAFRFSSYFNHFCIQTSSS